MAQWVVESFSGAVCTQWTALLECLRLLPQSSAGPAAKSAAVWAGDPDTGDAGWARQAAPDDQGDLRVRAEANGPSILRRAQSCGRNLAAGTVNWRILRDGLLPIPPRSLSLPTYSCVDPPPPSTLISRGEVSHRCCTEGVQGKHSHAPTDDELSRNRMRHDRYATRTTRRGCPSPSVERRREFGGGGGTRTQSGLFSN